MLKMKTHYRNTIIYGLGSCIALISSCDKKTKNKANTQPTKETKPNIVLVFADDMGYGDLSCYGHPVIKTPNLDKMADDGIRFTSFYVAASVSTPSRASLLTGRCPIRNAPHNFGPGSMDGLPLSEITIADILGKAGYQSMAIGKWHLGHQPQYLPTSRGFDAFYGLPYSNDMIRPWCPWLEEVHNKLYLYEDTVRVKEIGFEQDDLTVDYTEKALEFIQKNKQQPFFLYLAHSMPHLPVSTSDEFRGKSKAGLYGDVIQTIDWSVGEILKKLKELDIDQETLVIFTSDNGPWLNLPDRMLQKGVERWHGGSPGLLRGAKATSYEGGFRVPAIIRWNKHIQPNRINDEIVTTMDLFATLVELAGSKLPEDRKIDGNNILPLLLDSAKSPTQKHFYLTATKAEAVRSGKWKLRIAKANEPELFNLHVDPAEKYNQANRHPEIVNQLYALLQEFSKETEAELQKLDSLRGLARASLQATPSLKRR